MGNTHMALMHFSWAMDLDPKGANSQIKDALDPTLNRANQDDLSALSTPAVAVPGAASAGAEAAADVAQDGELVEVSNEVAGGPEDDEDEDDMEEEEEEDDEGGCSVLGQQHIKNCLLRLE